MSYTKVLAKTGVKSCTTTESIATREESLGQLVLLGFDVTVFTPAAYLRRRLQRPSMEFSSGGWLRT